MNTSFKLFEKLDRIPEVGDYVICIDSTIDILMVEFLSKNIGRITDIKNETPVYIKSVMKENFTISIFFKDVPEILIKGYGDPPWDFSLNELEFISKDREDCELYLSVKKYNL